MRRNVQLPRKLKPGQLGRLLCRVRIDRKTGCWIVDGRRGHRRKPKVMVGKETVYAHRYVYEALVGQILAGLVIDHLCGEGGCVNPLHMEPVSQAENVRRGRGGEALRAKTHCCKRHPLSGQNLALHYDAAGQAHRVCRICGMMRVRAYRERKKTLPSARQGNLIGGIDEYEPKEARQS